MFEKLDLVPFSGAEEFTVCNKPSPDSPPLHLMMETDPVSKLLFLFRTINDVQSPETQQG
jgi:hypothetical protein